MQRGDGPSFGGGSQDESDAGERGPESIRDLQRRRRDATRLRADMESLLAVPLDDEDDEEAPAQGPASGQPAAAPARVWVVFQGAKWEDPDGGLRESDSIAGVYATEEAAWRAAAELRKTQKDRQDAWYQPYQVASD
jgi:hypothetical protein